VQSLEIGFFIITEMAAINNCTDSDNHNSRDIYNIISYNLHGFNNGRSGLIALCDDPNTFVVAIQEHWLRPDNLHLLNEVHPEFVGCGISSMSDRLGKQIYSGRRRPYGGVGFLWRKSCNRIRIGYKARSGRALSISLELDSGNSISIASVYFPCFSTSSEYKNELSECLSDIEEILMNSCNVIVAGDTNFACDSNNEGYKQLSRLLVTSQ